MRPPLPQFDVSTFFHGMQTVDPPGQVIREAQAPQAHQRRDERPAERKSGPEECQSNNNRVKLKDQATSTMEKLLILFATTNVTPMTPRATRAATPKGVRMA